MKHVALVLLLGALAGALSHVLWYGFRRPLPVETDAGALAWLQQDLQLTPEQFARVQAIHERSSAQLQQLAAQAARMRAEFDAFERRRQTDGEIDFLAFARFVQDQRELDRLCTESTRRLVAATAGEMSPRQRERYLDRFDPSLRPATVGLN